MASYPTFRDGKRSIDFILVFKTSSIVTEKVEKKYKTFLGGLEKLGLEQETEQYSINEDVVFIKLHAPDSLVQTFAGLFDIDLACQAFEYRPNAKPTRILKETPLTHPNINDPIYGRAPESIGGDIPKKVTTGEKIMVVHQILRRCIWGKGASEYGIKRLIDQKVFLDAFPLHDGDYEWTISGPLNDRQLLALYWGSARCWNKQQPLNLIEKYFGTEYAIYFAWLEMYTKLLIPAAALSIVVIGYGIITWFTPLNRYSQEVCSSKIVMCPLCHYSKCPREYLNSSCYYAQITYLFDNWIAVIFSAVMSIWATIFMEMWQREESVLRLQWNLKSLEHTMSLRPEYIEKATRTRFSGITGKMEPYIPTAEMVCRYTVTVVTIILLLIIMCAATFGVMIYRMVVIIMLAEEGRPDIVTRELDREIIAAVTGSLVSSVFIYIFAFFYENITLFLNNLEAHRTWESYSNAYIYKTYALAFVNNYSAVFYIAFFKGRFFTYPGDLKIYTYLGGLNTDVCDYTGCILDLAFLLGIIMCFKAFMSNVEQVYIPKLVKEIKRRLGKIKWENIPQWEREYLMVQTDEFFIVKEYMEMVIQYGFVNFFIMGFPLAPLLALLNNISELRVDASKVTKSYRRPNPTKVVGLGAWFGILQSMTYIGVVTNALVIAFTSNFMEKAIYAYLYGMDAPGFLNQTMSEFDMNQFEMLDAKVDFSDTPVCYYQGKRYPTGHEYEHQNRKDFWHHLGIKFSVVVIFEHVVIIIKGLLAYAIPDVPFSVKQQLVYEEKMKKKKKTKEMSQAYMKKREGTLKL